MSWIDYLGPLWQGAWITIQLAIYSTVLGAATSFLGGIGRTSKCRWIRVISTIYVDFFRGTSLLIQLFWLYFTLPLIGNAIGVDLKLSPIVAGVLSLGLNIGAYGAEVVRGGLGAVSAHQREAGEALNFTPRQILWCIELPQAIPEMLPAFGNLAVQNLKDTALVSLISLSDLAFRAEQIRNFTQDSVTVYTMVLLMYFAMALVLSGGIKAAELYFGRWRSTAR